MTEFAESLFLGFLKKDLFYFSQNNFSKIFIFSFFIILPYLPKTTLHCEDCKPYSVEFDRNLGLFLVKLKT